MLEDRQLNALRERLGPVPGLRLALLFGSAAFGRERENSDVDVALLCETPLSGQERLSLAAELDRSIGREVDLVDLYGVPEPLTGEALQGRVLIDRGGARIELTLRHLANVEDFVPLQRRLQTRRPRTFLGS